MHLQKPYKIARKLEWKHRFALRAKREYKKSIYLGAGSDFVVTPSKLIDHAWHELSFLSANLYHTTNQILHCVQDDSQRFYYSNQYNL